MITFSDRQVMSNLPATEYFAIKAYSNSFLKSEQGGVAPEFKPSDKVKLGSAVDAILTDTLEVDLKSEFYPIAKKIAVEIANEFGFELWSILESQVAFTAIMEHAGLKMLIKGRLDKFGVGRVWDLKITHCRGKQLDALIERMGYDNQMWLYSNGMGVKEDAVLIFYSVPDAKVYFKFINVSSNSNSFFEDKILKFGK